MFDISAILKNIGEKQELNIDFDIDCLELNYETIQLEDKILFIGIAQNIDNTINIEGSINISFPILCYSCGEEFIFKDTILINECFLKSPNEGEYIIQNGKIDLEKAIIDNLILNLPSRFLCKNDCKGICPICMKNRNFVKCNCNNLQTDPRFDKLKQLLK